MGKRGKIVGREHFSLDDGEIDLNLIDPAGMDRGMHQKSIGPAGSDTIDCLLAAMSRAVIHDPKDALGGFIRFTPRNLSDEPTGGSNATLFFRSVRRFWLDGRPKLPNRSKHPRGNTRAQPACFGQRPLARGVACDVALEYWFFRPPR